MNVLSIPFAEVVVGSCFLVWLFSRKSKVITIALCNLLFFVLLQGKVVDYAYVVGLVVFVYASCKVTTKKWQFVTSLVVVVGGLCFYKYAAYFTSERILMPLGLSFYSFKAIRYLVDVYQKKIDAKNLLEVFDYICFFPSFLAGPIHKTKAFFEELESPMVFDYYDQKNGFVQVFFGLFEKLVIADAFYQYVVVFLQNEMLTGWYVVVGVFVYAMQIYADFDAYSNVAIGTARMLGIHLGRNFHTPYLAWNIRDFWRRWHISLSTWLKEYIYIPLGGNRKGRLRKYFNVLVVFLVSGIWHGSTMMFVIWGLGHGCLTIVEDRMNDCIKNKYVRALFVPLNFVLVSILWVFFQASSMEQALSVFTRMKDVSTSFSCEAVGLTLNEFYWLWILVCVVFVSDLCRYKWDMLEWLSRRWFIVRWFVYAALIVVAIVFGVYGPGFHPEDFIYVTF